MTLVAPILKLQTLARRFTSQHVPVLVEAADYEAVVGDIQGALREAGWETSRRPASWMLRAPTRVLTALAGGSIENLVAERLTTLRSDRLAVTLHPADLVVAGRKADVVHVRALLVERLALSRAHLTWTKEGNILEDRLRQLWRDAERAGSDGAQVSGRLRVIEEDLERVELPYEEWEVLFRSKLLVEVAAGAGLQREPDPGGWVRRTLLPLGLAVLRERLENPRVRDTLDAAVVRWLGGAHRAGTEAGRPMPEPDSESRPAA